jgi:hypothetical protein
MLKKDLLALCNAIETTAKEAAEGSSDLNKAVVAMGIKMLAIEIREGAEGIPSALVNEKLVSIMENVKGICGLLPSYSLGTEKHLATIHNDIQALRHLIDSSK